MAGPRPIISGPAAALPHTQHTEAGMEAKQHSTQGWNHATAEPHGTQSNAASRELALAKQRSRADTLPPSTSTP